MAGVFEGMDAPVSVTLRALIAWLVLLTASLPCAAAPEGVVGDVAGAGLTVSHVAWTFFDPYGFEARRELLQKTPNLERRYRTVRDEYDASLDRFVALTDRVARQEASDLARAIVEDEAFAYNVVLDEILSRRASTEPAYARLTMLCWHICRAWELQWHARFQEYKTRAFEHTIPELVEYLSKTRYGTANAPLNLDELIGEAAAGHLLVILFNRYRCDPYKSLFPDEDPAAIKAAIQEEIRRAPLRSLDGEGSAYDLLNRAVPSRKDP